MLFRRVFCLRLWVEFSGVERRCANMVLRLLLLWFRMAILAERRALGKGEGCAESLIICARRAAARVIRGIGEGCN